MIVYDVVVDGTVRETIRPNAKKLRDISRLMKEELKMLGRKYGPQVQVKRRMVF